MASARRRRKRRQPAQPGPDRAEILAISACDQTLDDAGQVLVEPGLQQRAQHVADDLLERASADQRRLPPTPRSGGQTPERRRGGQRGDIRDKPLVVGGRRLGGRRRSRTGIGARSDPGCSGLASAGFGSAVIGSAAAFRRAAARGPARPVPSAERRDACAAVLVQRLGQIETSSRRRSAEAVPHAAPSACSFSAAANGRGSVAGQPPAAAPRLRRCSTARPRR